VTGETLPGLLRAQDVSHFHEVTRWIQNIDEANAKKREVEAAQKQQAENTPTGEERVNSEASSVEISPTEEAPSGPAIP
jgi:hypothetical protein